MQTSMANDEALKMYISEGRWYTRRVAGSYRKTQLDIKAEPTTCTNSLATHR